MEDQTAQKKAKSVVYPGRISRGRLVEGQHANVQSILHGSRIQPKLRVGQPNDKYEQEADRVAEQVMRMTAHQPQSFSGTPQGNSGAIQRTCAACANDEALIQTKTSGSKTPEVTPAIGTGIQSLQGGGQPLSKSERGFFEPRFGTDFSGVRLHSDARAAGLTRSLNARAFTLGNSIVFAEGEYKPYSNEGRRLISHELVHIIQQTDHQGEQIMRTCNCSTTRTPSATEFEGFRRIRSFPEARNPQDICVDDGSLDPIHGYFDIPAYNCYAHSISRNDVYLDDNKLGEYDTAGTGFSYDVLENFYLVNGFRQDPSTNLNADILVYGTSDLPLHAARRVGHDCFSSKLGHGALIRHEPLALQGGEYGNIVRSYHLDLLIPEDEICTRLRSSNWWRKSCLLDITQGWFISRPPI